MERTIEVGSQWLHFKGKYIATVIVVAKHTETNEELVVYECFDTNTNVLCGVFARPLDMFLSKVDKEKYPDCKQIYRFERVN